MLNPSFKKDSSGLTTQRIVRPSSSTAKSLKVGDYHARDLDVASNAPLVRWQVLKPTQTEQNMNANAAAITERIRVKQRRTQERDSALKFQKLTKKRVKKALKTKGKQSTTKGSKRKEDVLTDNTNFQSAVKKAKKNFSVFSKKL